MKKTIKILSTILTFLIMGVALFAVVFAVFSSKAVDNDKKSLFGWKFFVVLSDSMSATDFSAGDMIFVKEVDVNTLKKDDIITFYSQDTKSFGEIVTHKIREVKFNDDGTLKGFVTYGTTTNSNDEALADPSLVIGKYQTNLPRFGYFIQFMKTPVAYILFVALPFALIIGHEVYKCFKIINLDKKEKLKKETEERDKLLEEERLRNDQMQRELEELKKQIAASIAANNQNTTE